LLGIAYRMLGTMADAEDVVGDVAERWLDADHRSIEVPEAWLVTAVSRRSLDVLKSARRQREDYPGVWMPEPVCTAGSSDPAWYLEQADGLSTGLLLVLERLTPLERAVFVLHDVLDYSHPEVAAALGRSEPACRQALHRARRHVGETPRRPPPDDASTAIAAAAAQRMLAAVAGGDHEGLLATLAPDVVLVSDGGGEVYAAMRPVSGPDRVARFLTNLLSRADDDTVFVATEINGWPGYVAYVGGVWAVGSIETAGSQITAIRAWVSPDKIARIVGSLPEAAGRPSPHETTASRFRYRRGKQV
jgi:RNA polymerase sigma-70 factor (ECF subfamily)